MKKLFTIMCILLNGAITAQCLEDSARQATYNYMEVFNYTTEKYEKYTKKEHTNMIVTVIGIDKIIYFRDPDNNYNIDFEIVDCFMDSKGFVYKCFDLKNRMKCDVVFGATQELYNLTVTYDTGTAKYRLKRSK